MKSLTPATRRRLLEQTDTDLTTARQLLEASLELIHDSLHGHPQAARYDDQRRTRLWCFTHERNHTRCEHDGLPCGGTPITTTDPTGDAATTTDQAATAQHDIDRRITTLATFSRALLDELTRWQPPSTDMQHPDPTSATAPDGWCTSCWRDNRTHEPITTRPDGTPYYTGLCRFCGGFRTEYRQLPPLAILRLRHTGRRITETVINRHLPSRRTPA